MGYLMTALLQISMQEIVKMKKKFENRSVFDEVMPQILLVPFFSFFFFGHGVVGMSPIRNYIAWTIAGCTGVH